MERDHVEFRFRAARSRSGFLAWGQQRVADLMSDLAPDHAPLNLSFSHPIRSEATIDEVTAAIREMVEECESVRTLYDLGADIQRQHVVARGTLRVRVVSVDRGTCDLAEESASALAAAAFGPGDLPIRMSIMVDRDGPAFLLFAVSHLASDFLGSRRLVWHLRHVLQLAVPPAEADLVTAHPVDVSDWENSEAGRREGARALLRHERSLRRMPQSMLPRLPIEPLRPRYQYVEMQTAAGAWCLSHLAGRHGVSETAVGHAAFSLVLSQVSNLPQAHLLVCAGNRFDRAFAAAVASLTQDVPTCVTAGDTDVDTLLRRSAGAVRQATMTGRFPHRDLMALRSRVENERGFPLDLSFWLNSRLLTPVAVEAPTDGRLRNELTRTSIRWLGGDQRSTSTLFVYLDRLDDVLVVRTLVDTAYVTRDETEQWLRAVESILVAAVLRPERSTGTLAADAGLVPFDATADWALIDQSWIHLPTATARLRAAAPGAAVRLAVETVDGRPSLLGIVSGPAPGRGAGTPAGSDAVRALRGCKVAMRPHRFVAEGGL